ncbi:Ig-like domain-containing protein [Pseudomonas sp. SWRI81]|nr:Ig-like domain-containing protein [Pseudomonas sp. SWRI81]
MPLTALSASAHSITVKALYGSNPVSAAWTFTVAVATAPTITSVKDSKGEVAAGGTTFDTSVTVSGKAFANQKVEIFDGATSKGEVLVDASGNWTLPLTALSASAHSITVKALYGSNPVSAAWTFTVAVATAPTITSVKDSKGEVAAGGTTFDTSVTVSGKAFANQKVEIFDGATSKGEVLVDASGNWTLPLTALSASAHSITVKALYGSNPVSAAWTFTVAVATAPTLTSVKGYPSGVEILHGGYTVERAVTLSGVAANGQKVEVFDGAVSKGQATAHATTGVWTLLVSALAVAAHSFTAKALYGSNPVSAARTFTVAEPLRVETSLMSLNGVMVRSGYCTNFTGADAVGNTAQRQPTGGVPGYAYSSSDPSIAAVDGTGKVTGMGNGSATIRIYDRTQAQVSYTVSVSNVYDLLVGNGGSPNTYAKYLAHLSRYGYVSMTPQIRAVLARCYHQPWIVYSPASTTAWTGIANGTSAEVYIGNGTFAYRGQNEDHTGLIFSLHGFSAAQDEDTWEISSPPLDEQ